jgi:DNA-binding IclR family transcriptional regulator
VVVLVDHVNSGFRRLGSTVVRGQSVATNENSKLVDDEPEGELVQSGPAEGGGKDSSSLTKMLSILDFFTSTTPVWSTNDLIEKLETSRSTGYRYIKAMHTAGLLSAVGNGYYVLGPRIVELDLQIRNCDPLHAAGKGVLEELVSATGHSAILCMLFRNSVLCIREHLAPLSPENMFSRGQKRPLFRGAMSKVILANLPNHRLRSIFSRSPAVVHDAGLGSTWDEFRTSLGKIRKDGYAFSHGEFNPGIVGVAAPVFNSEKLILGSVGVAWHEEDLQDVDISRIVMIVKRAAREITQRVASATPGMDLPPRAVG